MGLGLYIVILLLFASVSTAHLLLCWKLFRLGWWRPIVAFLVPPLAPYWGYTAQVPRLPMIWVGLAFVYGIVVILGAL